MNLLNEEMYVALSLLIKRNPITEVVLDENNICFRHLDNSIELIPLPENPEPEPFNYQVVVDAVSEYVNTKTEEINNLLVDSIQGLSSNTLQELDKNKEELQKLKSDIDVQIEYLKERPLETREEKVIVYEQYDDSNLKIWVKSLLAEIKPVIENHHHHEERINEEVDYLKVQNLIDKAVLTFNEKYPARFIVGIEQKLGSVIVVYSDGTKQVLLDLMAPSVSYGGGGSGPAGLSAYQIAVAYGFVGSESQWLNSLKAEGSSPEDGTISYDVDGNIESILVGDETTIFNRDVDGNIESIEKSTYFKIFNRDVDGKITGWTIEYK